MPDCPSGHRSSSLLALATFSPLVGDRRYNSGSLACLSDRWATLSNMKRRSFLSSLAAAFVAASVDLNLAASPAPIKAPRFDPKTYVGEYRWISMPR